MKLPQFWNCLQFHDDHILDDQVDALTWNPPLFVGDVYGFLAFEAQAPRLELQEEGPLVDSLSESWTQRPVYFDSTADRLADDLFLSVRQRGSQSQHVVLRVLRELRIIAVASCQWRVRRPAESVGSVRRLP